MSEYAIATDGSMLSINCVPDFCTQMKIRITKFVISSVSSDKMLKQTVAFRIDDPRILSVTNASLQNKPCI